MHGAIVIVVLLGGLGCQNKSDDAGDVPKSVSPLVSPEVNPFPRDAVLPPYPGYYPVGNPDADYPSQVGIVQGTICSFFLGRDPDVRTQAEIEASVYGYGNGAFISNR